MKLTRRQLAQIIVANAETPRANQAVQSVANYLVGNGRANEAELLVREIEEAAQRTLGHATARVVSAHELSGESEQAVFDVVARVEKSESVELIKSIDPSLLGGVRINTPEREIDLSVSGRLTRMKGTL